MAVAGRYFEYSNCGNSIVNKSWAFNGLMSTAALLLPLTAATESQIRSGAPSASLSATAQLNFKIIIPKVLYLRVGRDGVILSTGAGKGIAQEALCSLDQQRPLSVAAPSDSAVTGRHPVTAGRLLCTASMP